MQVFVTGATGYVGFGVATGFSRAGHTVWGLTRSEAKGRRLARHEIRPVVGDLANPATYADVAAECAVLVHAAYDYTGDGVAKDRRALEALIESSRRGAKPKTLIFTSGVWVFGDTGNRLVDETTPLNPIPMVAWRPAHERLALEAPGVRGLVIRPGCVYGGQGGMAAEWFEAGSVGKAPAVVGDGLNRWAMVHVDDLAEAYVRAAESHFAGEIFNVTDRSRATVLEMARAAARAAGFTGEIRPTPLSEARRTPGDFAEALALTQHVDARKAVRLLGWQPRHGGFLDAADVYYRAWSAWQD